MIESRAAFRKSSFSDPDKDCVEVARRSELVEVRDSKVAFGIRATLARYTRFLPNGITVEA